jgi:integrase
MLWPSDASKLKLENINILPSGSLEITQLASRQTRRSEDHHVFFTRLQSHSFVLWSLYMRIYNPKNRSKFLFFNSKQPTKGLQPSTISGLIKKVAGEAGVDVTIFTARTFRSGGASAAINAQINPSVVIQLGRWRDPSTFYNHYVATQVPNDYTDRVLCIHDLHDKLQINSTVEELDAELDLDSAISDLQQQDQQ